MLLLKKKIQFETKSHVEFSFQNLVQAHVFSLQTAIFQNDDWQLLSNSMAFSLMCHNPILKYLFQKVSHQVS